MATSDQGHLYCSFQTASDSVQPHPSRENPPHATALAYQSAAELAAPAVHFAISPSHAGYSSFTQHHANCSGALHPTESTDLAGVNTVAGYLALPTMV
jgi:hypothetical protein